MKLKDIDGEQLHALLFLNAPFGMMVIDRQDHLIDANTRACDILGYSKDRLLSFHARDIIHPDDIIDTPAERLLNTLDIKNEIHLERRYKKSNGTYLFVTACVKPFRGNQQFLIIFQDISDQKKAKDALKESEKKYKKIFENAGDAIFFIEAEGENIGRIVDTNTAAADMHGFSKQELLSMSIRDLDVEEHLVTDRIRRMLSGERLNTEILHKRKDGSHFPVSVSAGMVEFGDKKYILGFDRDISEQKHAEQDKKELETRLHKALKLEAIGTLAGGIAHDFNNILSGILGASQLAEINITDPDKLKRNIDQIHKASLRAADLVRHILTFNKDSKHKKQPLQVYLVLIEALKLLRSTIPSTIEIKEQIETHAAIMGDYTQIHQVIMNLCINAYQAIGDNYNALIIRLKETEVLPSQSIPQLDILPGKYVLLEVEDTGCGMDSETIEKIFDPYFTTKEKHNGTGLGLSTVHGIVKNHDGFINARSEVKKGSIFSLFFPIIQDSLSLEIEEAKTAQLPRGDENIMIVDDEESILEPSKGFIEDHGYTVSTFTNGEDALTAFKKEPDRFDLIITDLIMPRLAGDILSNEMLKKRPDLPIILCSGNMEKIAGDDILNSGVKKAIPKPIDMESLIVIIRELLDN